SHFFVGSLKLFVGRLVLLLNGLEIIACLGQFALRADRLQPTGGDAPSSRLAAAQFERNKCPVI
ncbi:MAG: hypothetical protein L0Z50_37375, partial [Verrucomicrobiales bacterium]|nr:hypothetical protein [Verrucomicrobiales bacterium]